MNTSLLKLARKHFCSDLVPARINRANARAWAKSVRQLGDKWVARQPVARMERAQ